MNRQNLIHKLDRKIINVIKPSNMTYEQYCIECNLNNITPSMNDGMFLHWVMTANGSYEQECKVHKMLLNALINGYLLDANDKTQCQYFFDAIVDILPKDLEFARNLIEVVFKRYSKIQNYSHLLQRCQKLNKAIGLTSTMYFDNNEHVL